MNRTFIMNINPIVVSMKLMLLMNLKMHLDSVPKYRAYNEKKIIKRGAKMNSKIYYFSGTGNSFAVSRKLEELLIDKGEIVHISTFKNENNVEIDADVVGFVFPVYFATIPDVVKAFIEKINFKTNPYIFAIVTCNGVAGHSLFTLNNSLNVKGKSLASGFSVDMPGNALITPDEIIKERLKNSTKKIEQISEIYNGEVLYQVNLEKVICNDSTIQKLILSKNINEIIDWYKLYDKDESILHNYNSITPNCPRLEAIEADKNNNSFTSIDGVLYSKDMTILYDCPPGKEGILIVPEGVKSIGSMAFQECAKLTSIYLPASLYSIGEGTFGGNSSLTELVVSEDNSVYQSKFNVIYTKDGETLVAYAGGMNNKDYTIPKGVKEIGSGAFMGCTYLETVSSNENLTTVGIEAFKNCKALKTVRFSKGLRDIYAGAFLNCSDLKDIVFPIGTRYVYNNVFADCEKLLKIEFPKSVQVLPSDLYVVEGRTIKLNNTNSTIAATIKAPAKAVKGKGKADTCWFKASKKEFSIKNPDQLAGLAVLVNSGIDFKGKTVTLVNDLDLSCYKNWIPIGLETIDIIPFRGTFNGNSHTIYNLRINSEKNFQGLFGEVIGYVKNLNMKNADVSGNSYVGLLAGYTRYGFISNCSVSGKVNGYEAVGGLIGGCYSSIKSCSVDVAVYGILKVGGLFGTSGKNITNCSNHGTVTGFDQVGGVSGTIFDGQINNCTNNMTITGDIDVGGIVGSSTFSKVKIINCFNKVIVSGKENVGGIIGSFTFGGTAEKCTNEGAISGVYHVGGIAGYLASGYIN